METSSSYAPPVLVHAPTGNDKLWAILCHLSEFVGAPFIIPLIVYLVMKDDTPFVRLHAREALNFHLSLLLYSVVCVPLIFVIIGIPLLIAIWLAALVFAIIAAIKAGDGKHYAYPLTIRFVS